MKTNYIYLILLIVLFISTISGWMTNISLKKRLNELSSYNQKLLKRFSAQEEILNSQIVTQSIVSNHFNFPKSTEFVSEENKRIKAIDITGNKNVLVIKLSKRYCHTCIEAELKLLEDLYKDDFYKKTIIILTDLNPLEMKIFKRKYNIKYPIYSAQDSNFKDLTIELLNTPYLFTLDSTLEAKWVFAPDQRLPEASIEYYRRVKKKYKTSI